MKGTLKLRTASLAAAAVMAAGLFAALPAAAVEVINPTVTIKVRDGINNWLDNHGCSSVSEIIGALEG